MRESIQAALVREEPSLRGFVSKRAAALLRYEDVGDLVQSIILRALDRAPDSSFNSQAELRAWLFTVATNYMADRRTYWQALKRGGGQIARLSLSQDSAGGVPMPPNDDSGPLTRAARRELLVLSTRALAALPARDRELVQWRAEGLSLDLQAERLGTSYPAAQRAGLRAFERFRKLFEIISTNYRESNC